VWTVFNVARVMEILFKKHFLIIYLFLPLVAYGPEGRQKLDQLQKKLYETTLFIYLFIITYKY